MPHLRRGTAVLAAAFLAGPVLAGSLSPYGVNVHAPEGAQQAVIFDAVRDASAGWVRIDLSWSQSEPRKGVFDWSVSDAVVAGAVSRGLLVYAAVGGTPAWATAGDPERGVPRDALDWADFCARAAARYQGAIRVWGIWNEPNRAEGFAGTREEYLGLILGPAADAIHAASPGALVAAPDTAHTVSNNSNWYRWLQDTILKAGDRVDILTHHVYDSGPDAGVTKKLDATTPFGNTPDLWDLSNPSVREVLQRMGWFGRPFWLTETGWASDQVGEAAQASYLSGLLGTWFGTAAPNPWIGKLFVYEAKDDDRAGIPRWGLQRPDGSRKPAWTALRDFARANPPPGDDADVVAETVPGSMEAGSAADAAVRLRNAGSTTWSPAAGYRLLALDDAGSFGPGRIALPVAGVPPGAEVVIPFRLLADVPAGSYRVGWTMTTEAGPFGSQAAGALQVTGTCPPPPAPIPVPGPASPAPSGSLLVFSWAEAPGCVRPPAYRYELSASPGFGLPAGLVTEGTTPGHSFVYSTQRNADEDLSFRVRAEAGCGTPGDWSAAVRARTVRAEGPFAVLDVIGLPFVTRPGVAPAPARVRVRNAGPVPALVRFGTGGLFAAVPDVAYVDVGGDATVEVAPLAQSIAVAGLLRDTLSVAWSSGSAGVELFLAVTEERAPGARPAIDRETLSILARPGEPAEASVVVTNPSAVPSTFVPSVAPAGAWLRFDLSSLARPFAPGERRTVRLSADRGLWQADDAPPPARTVLTFAPPGGGAADSASVTVLHFEVPPSGPAPDRPPVAAGGSFVLPTAVHAAGALGQVFSSYGWLRNLGAEQVPVDLYATRAGEDGRSAVRIQQSIPGLSVLPLSDFVSTLFGADGFSGSVEVRGAAPEALSLRTTARGETPDGSSYETAMPAFAAGQGTGAASVPLVLTGLKSTPLFRTNVILAETSGSPARVNLRLFDWTGKELASAGLDVPASGQTQVPLAQALGVSGTAFEAASLRVEPASAAGRVGAIATVVDNSSASFSVVTGVPASAPGPSPLVVPSIVRSRGAGSVFVTDLSVTNVTRAEARVHFVYAYAGTDSAGSAIGGEASRDVVLPANGSLPIGLGNDVVRKLFLLPSDSNTSGTLRLEGPGAPSVVARAVASALVDPNGVSSGTKSAEFGSYSASSSEAVGPGASGVAIEPGLRKHDAERVNLILTEVAGAPATVRVRIVTGARGGLLGEKVLSLAPFQRIQLNDVWNGPGGFGLGSWPIDRVTVVLEGTAGTGRVVGAVTPIENASNSPRILVLGPPGPPPFLRD